MPHATNSKMSERRPSAAWPSAIARLRYLCCKRRCVAKLLRHRFSRPQNFVRTRLLSRIYEFGLNGFPTARTSTFVQFKH